MPTKRSSLASPINGLAPEKAIWSEIGMTEPGGMSSRTEPAEFVKKRLVTPTSRKASMSGRMTAASPFS